MRSGLSRARFRQKLQESRIDEQLLPADLALFQNADRSELFQIDGRRLPLGDLRVDEVVYPTIGLHKIGRAHV